ncbi:uncharacterized protein SPSC_05152 [Sporisorium scitamineum]|uniref:Uncharacterized protein n=1 Tax=Sporisorium scitamineum TaxID=49012 RepID=A0A127ZGT0_9BASI|nr:uncharacterized protein SPSC_05152 [Sporisorium scitamineum]
MDGLPLPPPGSMPPLSTPITTIPEVRQAFSSLAQTFEALAGPSNAEQRFQRVEASYEALATELARMQTSLTSTQEIVSSTQCDLAASRGLIRELQNAINRQTRYIKSLEAYVQQENNKIIQHLNGVSHGVSQFEARATSAHVQLNDRVTYHMDQQAAKMDNFQNSIVAPLFSALHQVVVGNTVNASLPSPRRIEPIPEEDKPQDPVQLAEQGDADTVATDHGRASSSAPSVDRTRSSSKDSNAPLADTCMMRSRDMPASQVAEQHTEDVSETRDAQLLASQCNTPKMTQSSRAAHPSPIACSSPAIRPSSENPGAVSSFTPRKDTRVTSAPVRVMPHPSPSSPESTSTHDAAARSTPGTSRASSLLLSVSGPVDSPMPNTASPTQATGSTESPPLKRKRSSSIELVRMNLVKTLANKAQRREAGHLTPQRPVDEQPGRGHSTARTGAETASTSALFLVGPPRPLATVDPRRRGASATNQIAIGVPAVEPMHNEGGLSVQSPRQSWLSQTPPRSVAAEQLTPQSVAGQLTSSSLSTHSTMDPVVLRQPPQSNPSAVMAPFHGSQGSVSQPLQPSNTLNSAAMPLKEVTAPSNHSQAPLIQPLQPSSVLNAAEVPSTGATADPRKQAPSLPPARGQAAAYPLPRTTAPLITSRESIAVTQTPRQTRVKAGPESAQSGHDAEQSSQPFASEESASTFAPQVATRPDQNQQQDVGSTVESVVSANQQLSHNAQPAIADNEVQGSCTVSEQASPVPANDIPSTERQTEPYLEDAASSTSPAPFTFSRQTTVSIPELSRSDPKQHSAPQFRIVGVASLPGKAHTEPSRVLQPERPIQPQSEPLPRHEEERSSISRPSEAADRVIAQTRVEWLAALHCLSSKGEDHDPYYIWAWLGPSKGWTSSSREATPVVVAPNHFVTDSLVAEDLANDLIRKKRATLKTQGTADWLELDVTWRFDMASQQSGGAKHFRATRCFFLIVPAKYMRDGITLGKNLLDELDLQVVPGNRQTRGYLVVAGEDGSGISLNAFPHHYHQYLTTTPFSRLCKLAEVAGARKDNPRFQLNRQGDRSSRETSDPRQDTDARRARGPRTPPLADRLNGTTGELAVGARAEASRSRTGEANRGMSSHQEEREAIWPHRVSRTDTSPCLPSQQVDADTASKTTGAAGVNVSGVVAAFDSGSPLSELDESDSDATEVLGEEEVDELDDE